MISTISILTSLIFAACYPLCFLMTRDHIIDRGFQRFNFGLTCFVAGIAAVLLQIGPVSSGIKIMAMAWVLLVGMATYLVWKYGKAHAAWVIGPSLVGFVTTFQFQSLFMGETLPAAITLMIGGMTLSSAIYAMNLGHAYLNVHGLPVRYLLRTVYVSWCFFALRLIWDSYGIFAQQLTHVGDVISVLQFSVRLDGFLLWVPIFFGTILPVILMYFVKETLKVKSTQSATGILYCIVIAVLMGDLAYRYYQLKFGIML